MLSGDHGADNVVDSLRAALAETSRRPYDGLVHQEHLPARAPTHATLRPRLPEPLGAALRASGIAQLYSHQVAALQASRQGQNVVVTTPTASGKSLCFHLPALERLLATPGRHALYLYPTKALMADQLRGLQALLDQLPLPPEERPRAAILSGDVPGRQRDTLRADPPSILLANPDILHFDLLRQHRRWRTFLASLDTIVLDELHAYRGVFGSHVALVLRRLRRLAAVYGSHPSCVAASATIANPEHLAEHLVGAPFSRIDGDGAGASARRFLFWSPPLVGDPSDNVHRSVLREAVGLFVELLRQGRAVILFGKSRVAVERMFADALAALGPDWAPRLSAYKAGYLAHERAHIEQGLREGRIRGVVATNALELGIDVGSLDAAVLAGYPGTVMSTWQQAGRVGRRENGEAVVVLVAGDDALDQYHLRHPSAFFGQPSESAVVDPGNPSMLLGHLLCAAAEAPLTPADLSLFPEGAPVLVQRLAHEGLLSPSPPWSLQDTAGSPHHQIGLRGASRESYAIQHDERTIASTEPPHLQRETHPGAVYLHNGRAYRVESIDADNHVVRVRPEHANAHTQPLFSVKVAPQGDPIASRTIALGPVEATIHLGRVLAHERVEAYKETSGPGRAAREYPLVPPLDDQLETIGLWIDWPATLQAAESSLHGAEHALVNVLPLRLLTDRHDVGSASDPDTAPGGRVTLYDSYEGGIGLAEQAYQSLEDLLEAARDLLAACPCADGCPACLHLPGCARANDLLSKHGALALLRGERPGPLLFRQPVPKPTRQMRAGRTRADRALQERVRRIQDDSLRERLTVAHAIKAGDLAVLPGDGSVLVREIRGDRAQVQYQGLAGYSWVPLSRLRT